MWEAPDVIVLSIAGLALLGVIALGTIFLFHWRRQRFRVGLKTLMIASAIACILLFLFVRYVYPPFARRLAIDSIDRNGGQLFFRSEEASGYVSISANQSRWHDVVSIEIDNDAEATRIVPQLHRIPEVEDLWLDSAVTDGGLSEICRIRQHPSLKFIEFFGSQITAAGISQLARLNWVKLLHFNTCPIGDRELRSLKELPSLEAVNLIEEGESANPQRFSEAGFAALGELRQLQSMWLVGLKVSDQSAQHLENLTRLKTLRIIDCEISPAAIEALREALPECEIDYRN